ncbi:riboflavin biosynthesis protein [Kaistia sp. 32K]|uniref:bifunctional riboflavin kinase/FAD synthetase n=1 Tax=Kaistia sp. 32K TaxID=2795690 RepID=UPI00191532B3|nr:bifunctional riboflavin kinase/FAD synthetase [Kaistia sp. 32K]BCP52488.1 riboflavin biosynthesis protein [Kaistia sp. 32K]
MTSAPAHLLPARILPLDAIPADCRGGAVAIGNFDGMHRGHQALLEAARSEGSAHQAPALLLTFEPHPRSVFRPDSPLFRLSTMEAKARLAAAFGLDGIVVARFDREFAETSADDFVDKILVERLGITAAIIGHDFQFGHDRLGSPAFLAHQGARHGFTVSVLGAVIDGNGQSFSSSRVRQSLEQGEIERANSELGYRWFVMGKVQHGDKRGRELGYPTANVRLPADCGLALGIYAVTLTRADGTTHDAVASYGRRPTFDNGAVLLEVHVFDFADSLYDEAVVITFHRFLRGEERFESIDALIAQMDRDSEAARRILANAGPGTSLDQRLALIAPSADVAPALSIR